MVSGRHNRARPSKHSEPPACVATSPSFSLALFPAMHELLKFKLKAPARRQSAHAHRLQLAQVSSYSHINIQPAVGDAENGESESAEGFIRKDSAQIEIEDKLIFGPSLDSPSQSPSRRRPQTFAEATMSTRRTRLMRRNSTTHDEDSGAIFGGPVSLESLGPFRYTFKKNKKNSKWSPLDLSATDSLSEVGSISELGSFSRAASPSLDPSASASSSAPPFEFRPPFTPSPKSQDPRTSASVETPDETIASFELSLTLGDTDPTPTQANFPDFDPTPTQASQARFDSIIPPTAVTTTESTDSELSDSQSTKDRTEEAMASLAQSFGAAKVGRDAFDSLEWDPDLPAAAEPDRSPEPVTVTPQPIAYTTVGSVVNPKAVPQFTAPNRIQRESSGRRPLLPMVHSRHHDYFSQPRGPPPSNMQGLNVQTSMQYTQQLAQSPGPFSFNRTPPPNSARSSRSARSLQQLPLLTEQEKNVLSMVHGTATPQIHSGNILGHPSTSSPSRIPSSSLEKVAIQAFNARDLMEEEVDALDVPIARKALFEKMQTLQRLAKFENPMQHMARSRLQEFSLAKPRGINIGPVLDNPTAAIEALIRAKNPLSSTNSFLNNGAVRQPGELDRGYQFPPPGLVDHPKTQTNPLFGAKGSFVTDYKEAMQSRSGYPAPLTAGPPGQRQFQGYPNKTGAGHNENSWASDARTLVSHSYANVNVQAPSPWADAYGMPSAPSLYYQSIVPAHSGGGCNTKLQDTVPIAVASKYYPQGFPSDMSGEYIPLHYSTQREIDQTSDNRKPQTADEEKAKENNNLDDWFYGGQRRFATMTLDSYTNEDELPPFYPLGPIERQSKKPLPAVIPKPIIPEDMDKLTLGDATAPLITAAFGSLLSYMNNSDAFDTKKHLSKFVDSPDWQIDSSEKGNNSFFGEDWGPPPKRAGRDSRYQSSFHNPRSTNWEA
jgi:hypothetical protein